MRIVRNSILFCVLQLAIYTGVSSQMVFVKDTIWRTPTDKLVSKVLSDVGPGSSQGLPLSVNTFSRFYPLSNNRILLLLHVWDMFVRFTPTFTNIDHGTRFTEVRLPDPPGNSSYLQWELDYRDTNTMYVIADGRDYFNYDVSPESYYTPDLGNTYIPIPHGIPVGMGLFEPGFGIQYAPFGVRRTLVTIEFKHAITGEIKPCSWRNNIIRDLIPWYDTTKVQVGFAFNWSHGGGVMYGIGLHPEAPQIISIVVEVDTLADSSWVDRTGLAVSTDSGTTWHWIEPPSPRFNKDPFQWVRVDPKTSTIVYSVSHLSSETDDVIRVSLPRITDVQESDVDVGNQLIIYPNPVNDNIFINILANNTQKKIEIYSSIGVLMYEHQVSEDAAQQTQIDTHAWSSGMYVLRVTEHSGVYSRSFIVSH
ncbi:MAG: T9SS type A sorting domain-containing protein [Ignavibacteria bacterium]|nr:T9SS type A sorting domain-containing protein [Ignavibacteria bacterium]